MEEALGGGSWKWRRLLEDISESRCEPDGCLEPWCWAGSDLLLEVTFIAVGEPDHPAAWLEEARLGGYFREQGCAWCD